ncbi:MAG: hypothetical protein AB8B83_03505, partial [Bdellovibrionales bacterium]
SAGHAKIICSINLQNPHSKNMQASSIHLLLSGHDAFHHGFPGSECRQDVRTSMLLVRSKEAA